MKLLTKIIVLAFSTSFFLINTLQVKAADVAKIIFSPQGQVISGKGLKVDVFVDSNVQVNAAQLNITYPADQITLTSVDTANSKFTIKAEETISPGMVKIARGNVQPLKGKNLLASLTLIPKNGSSLSKLGYSVSDSLVMSKDNVNVLSGSQVQTVKPVAPTPSGNAKDFRTILAQAVKEFFRGIFGK